MDLSSPIINRILIVSILPYFLDRESFWFEKNLAKILEARKTQIFLEANTLLLGKGLRLKLSYFLRRLDEMGYEKVQTISAPGEFSRRGGVVDVFPINLNYALRIEFYGNLVESIRRSGLKVTDEKEAKEILKKKLRHQKIYSDLRGLAIGDYVVHLNHGIGRFTGFTQLASKISETKMQKTTPYEMPHARYYVLEYARGDKLYVPVGLERKLSRYIGFIEPRMSRLGSPAWDRTKKQIKEEVEKLARELLELYAHREIITRPPYEPKNEMQRAFDRSFRFEETPDQTRAIEEIYRDLEEKDRPMDRILCGDVGFGKTEVALRASFKVAASGKQTAMICPTTILAHQHFQNFKERLKNFPINVDILSRLQTPKYQNRVIQGLKEGRIDLVVGTHRILSQDVGFKNLGLFIIDDEQRFGVRQKEKLKKLRISLDILSLTATPIPRTLYLALSSLKDISLIQTPPLERLPIKTFVLPWNEKIVKEAIQKEISREGQVYYLHNRIETIAAVEQLLRHLVPLARIATIHGRMPEPKLIEIMDAFRNKKIDVLVATTIIENGLDLANANTLIVANATRLGLAQAYQIRGRVGRSYQQSFAYFFHPCKLSKEKFGEAHLRLKALKEAEALGSGYKIALKDLEIRGAGNVLGKEQSGQVNQIGLNLYCQMLSDTIERLKRS